LPGHIEGEVAGKEPWHSWSSWSYAPAEVETVFGSDDIDQWHKVIAESSRLQIANWF
jgi:hypothetical protein